ncbi:MAG TPA: hypothetical protein VK076_10700 [Candidatus Sphingobacterium stercoripullorum]|uniref:Uncharacterized protein n=1 Tax=Candidatus Sphingobacterium stercoripullorum TaxID=2838759 RepID=A0A9D2AXQ3_9SPHI|nr:hypothetical protein [Candidatus Sphingobacterium stercoripullorum]HLR51036.1 hypothetical protein [Candidatus Sphingobacterium stercoripullorum]
MKNQSIVIRACLLLLALVTLYVNRGCEKQGQWIDARVLDFGSPAVDGCGFVLEIGDSIYFPANLQEKYQVDKKEIQLKYRLLEDLKTCGFSDSEARYQKLTINAIKDR